MHKSGFSMSLDKGRGSMGSIPSYRMTHLFKPVVLPDSFDTFPSTDEMSPVSASTNEEDTEAADINDEKDCVLENETSQLWTFDEQAALQEDSTSPEVSDPPGIDISCLGIEMVLTNLEREAVELAARKSARLDTTTILQLDTPLPRFSSFISPTSTLVSIKSKGDQSQNGYRKPRKEVESRGYESCETTAPLVTKSRISLVPSPGEFELQEINRCLSRRFRGLLSRELALNMANGALSGSIDASHERYSLESLQKANNAQNSTRTLKYHVNRAIRLYLQKSDWRVDVVTIWSEGNQLLRVNYRLSSPNLAHERNVFKRFLNKYI